MWLFDQDLIPRVGPQLGMLFVTLVWGCLVAGASLLDGTLRLPAPGRGLMEHYGFQASFVSAPLMLLTCLHAVSNFLRILAKIDDMLVPGADPAAVRSIVKPHVDSLLLRGNWRNALWLFMFIGVAVSIAIFRKLDAPREFWGNDVFNATRYTYGFLAANLFLLLLWGFVCPVGFFYALHLTFSSETIVARLRKAGMLRLDFLHVDRCGGMSRFGTLNFLVMLIYVWPFGAMYVLHLTHQYTYLSLIGGAIATSAAFVFQSIYGIYWVSPAITSERASVVGFLNARVAEAMDGTRDFAAALATLEYRERVLAVSSFPYSTTISAAVNIMRFAPAAIALANFVGAVWLRTIS